MSQLQWESSGLFEGLPSMDHREGNPSVRTKQKISFPEAWKIVEGVNKRPSYASVVAKQVVSVGCQTDAVEIRSATGATNVSATTGSYSAKPNQVKTPHCQKTTRDQ